MILCQFSRQFVINHLLPHREVDVIYNPVPDAMFEEIIQVPDSRTIVFFGRVMKSKGVHSLIKAFNKVARRFVDVKLKIIGDGEIDEARTFVDEAIKHQVQFCGYRQKEDLMREIDQAMFCVLPSYFENFSMAALEVMARSRALIYTSRASGPELIEDGVNGFMVDPDDVTTLAEKMEQLITNISLRQRLSKNGFNSCQSKYSASVIIPQIEKYYISHIR